MTGLCDQVLLDFLHFLRRTAHFLHLRNLACIEASFYELHQELQKTWKVFWGLSRLFPYAETCITSQLNGYLHSYFFMVCWHPTADPDSIMAGPTYSLLNSPSLSIFDKHLRFSFSQNKHNVYLTIFSTSLLYRMHSKRFIIIPYLHTVTCTATLPIAKFTVPMYLPVTSASNLWNHYLRFLTKKY